jgi:exopolysaccharide biosynthesis polyprenyl glycosylphosphotransferase
MLRQHHILFRRLHLAGDLLVVIGTYLGCYLIHAVAGHGHTVPELLLLPELLIPVLILGVLLSVNTQVYHYRFCSLVSTIWKISKIWLAALIMALVIFFAYPPWFPERAVYAIFATAGMLALTANHVVVWLALRLYRRLGGSYKNALIIGTGKLARLATDEILTQPGRGLRILGFLDWDVTRRYWRYRDIPVLGTLSALPAIAKSRQLDMVIFAVGYKTLSKISGIAQICNRMGLPAVILADVLGDAPVRRKAGEFFGRPAVWFEPAPRHTWAITAKSALDRVVAILALMLLAPLFALVAIIIKGTSPGPVFFRQIRIGLHGRKFTLWKFRTMVLDAEGRKPHLINLNEMSGPVFKMKHDPRVTKIGRFLRRTSIDELPQLLNVAKGEMSLVGPRPPLRDEVERYDGWERRRLSVKPGLTCLWQIGGRNKIDFEEWMKLDLEYIDNWSLRKDAEILVKTIPAVFRGTGAR